MNEHKSGKGSVYGQIYADLSITPEQQQLIEHLTNPTYKAPFEVASQIFIDTSYKYLADLEVVVAYDGTEEEKNTNRKILISNFKTKMERPDQQKLERYQTLRQYFVTKAEELGLPASGSEKSLIFFDDKAMRVDVGYGPKVSDAIFADFTEIAKKIGSYYFQESDYLEKLKQEKEALISRADSEVKEQEIKLIPESKDEKSLISQAFQHNQGLVIGEVHEEKSPKQFLIDNMDSFKLQGVTTIYMEHLLEYHQHLLDGYLKPDHGSQMPKELELYLDHLDGERQLKDTGAGFKQVVEAAKEKGIQRIIAIDSEATYATGVINSISDLCNENASLVERCKVMNMAMFDRFKEYNDQGKYIVFVGNAHASKCNSVPGISNLLGCPSIYVKDDITHNVEQNTTCNFDGLDIHFNAVVSRIPRRQVELNAPPSTNLDIESIGIGLNKEKVAKETYNFGSIS